jgi:hypothetical protein
MKSNLQPFKTHLPLFALATGLLLSQTLPAAVTFTNTPAAVSNTYTGAITLQIGGLTNGETVSIKEYLDVNGNGVIDAGDWLVHQFKLTDGQGGMVIGGVTNFNVPGDTDTTPGQITAKLNFGNGNFMQNIVGKYLFEMGSTSGRFAPITNSFSVTNSPYTQKITGNVLSNGTSTVVPNAVVMLFLPGGNSGPLAGVVADNSGGYSIPAPPGTYGIVAFKSNYVTDFSTPPVVALGSGTNVTTNLTVTRATASISGAFVDASNSSIGLPGVMVHPESTTGLLAIGFTDPNGNFNVPVTAGTWEVKADDTSLIVYGYLGLQNGTNVSAGQTNVILAVPQATALFYGSVTDNLGKPLAGVDVYASDNNQLYESDGYSDASGNYVTAAVGGLNGVSWHVSASSTAGYLFSQPDFDTNGGAEISAGQAMQANFIGDVATNTISGHLKNNSGHPIGGVGVWANATINGVQYNQNSVDTDTNGYYSQSVLNGTWTVGINNCTDCGNGLPSNYLEPQNQTVVISNDNVTVDFTAVLAPHAISGYLKDNNGDPIGGVGVWASDQSNGNYQNYADTDGTGHYSMGVVNGTWTVGISTCSGCSDGLPSNYLDPPNQTLVISNDNGTADFTALLAPNFITGSVKQGNGTPIVGVGVEANGSINGTNYEAYVDTDGNGNYSLNVVNGAWNVSVNCHGSGNSEGNGRDSLDNILGSTNYTCPNDQFPTISGNNTNINFIVALCGGISITPTNLPAGEVNVYYEQFVQASSCSSTFSWSFIAGSPPPGLHGTATNNEAELYGTPTNAGIYYFTVQVIDGNGLTNTQAYSLTINAAVQVATTNLPNATDGVFYSQLLQAGDGLTPYTWSLSPGSAALPAGLTLTNGVIAGIPTTNGPFNFSVRVTDAAGATEDQPLSLTITPAPLGITTTSLPAALENVLYTNALTASGGQPPYTWSSTNLPAGLTLATNGLISGTLTNIGTNDFTVQVTDFLGATTNQVLALTVLLAQGSLQVTIEPIGAATNGAEWQVDGGAWNANGAVVSGLSVGTNHVLAFKVIYGWSAPSNQMATITSGTTNQATGLYTKETVKHVTLTITAPESGQSLDLTNDVFTVTGTAKDNLPAKDKVAVEAVYYQVNESNRSNWTPATPVNNSWSNWSASVTLNPGANTIRAYAVDTSNNTSTITNVAFKYIPSAILYVSTNGFGTVHPKDNGKLLAIGTNYTNTAVPGKNWIFSNWVASGSENFVSNNPVLKFKMQSNLVLTANFVTNVFLAAKGTYNGLFAPANAPRQQTNSGAITFTLATNGALSGKLTIGTNTPSLNGQFNPAGAATITTPRKGLSTLTTTLQLDFASQTVSGSVSNTDGSFEAQVTADLEQKTTNYEGRYTLIIPGANDPTAGPFGTSCGTAAVESGAISFVGYLADGTNSVSQASSVSKDGYWPFYVPLYGGHGSLWSWNCFTNTNGAMIIFSTNASWINATNANKAAVYRSGFTNEQAAIKGSVYTWTNKPLLSLTGGQLTNLQVILEWDNPPFAITNTQITLTSSNTISVPGANVIAGNTNKLALTITRTNGVISGSFVNPFNAKQTLKVKGVLLQGQTKAEGYFLGTNQSGTFLLMSP